MLECYNSAFLHWMDAAQRESWQTGLDSQLALEKFSILDHMWDNSVFICRGECNGAVFELVVSPSNVEFTEYC